MLNKITARMWNLFVFVSCAAMVSYAIYVQYVDYLDPCPLCILQRVAFMWMAAFALLAAVHNPAVTGRRVYAWLVTLGAVVGAGLAGRHVWLQHLPPDLVPECGPGLNYMLENFPITEVLSTVLRGSGSCAELDWTLLGVGIPVWTLLWFIGLGVVSLWFAYRKERI